MTAPEFSRPVRVDSLGATSRALQLTANPQERAALAKRFDLATLDRLEAQVSLSRTADEDIALNGRIVAEASQSCVVTGEPVAQRIDRAFELLFRVHPAGGATDDEVELGEGELDVVFHDGGLIDVGEAVAETLALNLDPYPRADGSAEALKVAGVKDEDEARSEASPFAALAALKDKLKS